MSILTADLARVAVVVAGEALVDEFHDRQVAGGAPFNLARSLAALLGGDRVLLLTRVGAGDAGARAVLASLARFGMGLAGVQQDASRPTGRVTVSETEGGHSFHIHAPAAWDFIEPAPALLTALHARFFCFGTLALRGERSRLSILEQARTVRALGGLVYLDLNLRRGTDTPELAALSLAGADWLKVNDEELDRLLCWFGAPAGPAPDPLGPAAALGDAVRGLMQRFGLQRLILTRGAAGYAAFDAEGGLLAEGAGVAVPRLADTVGAGDGFSAMLLAATLSGLPPDRALALANGYAAALCGQRGPIPDDDAFFLPWRQRLGQGACA